MIRDSSLLNSLDKAVRTKVKIGNGEIVQAKRRGTVSIHISQSPKFIHDFLLISNLNQNLLPVAQLMKKIFTLI